ncbi:hypothetical protein [Pedobacter sp. GR22-6]|uniref:hypothetical protein n=1 Tax=Pedobacter sp. GR22-6 TaxID=3127957 RepID=UPI00307EF199
MKNFKNLAFGLVAGALALGFSAFTNVQPASADAKFTTANYGYNITTMRYELISGEPSTLSCELGGRKCVVVYDYSTPTPPAFIDQATGDASPTYGDSPETNSHYFE